MTFTLYFDLINYVDHWNDLPEMVVKANNLNIFRAKKDDSMKGKCLIHFKQSTH